MLLRQTVGKSICKITDLRIRDAVKGEYGRCAIRGANDCLAECRRHQRCAATRCIKQHGGQQQQRAQTTSLTIIPRLFWKRKPQICRLGWTQSQGRLLSGSNSDSPRK